MSKSIGNVHSVRDIIARGHRASALRYLLLSTHYRKQLTFSWDGLDQAEAALTRLRDFVARLETRPVRRRTSGRGRSGRRARARTSAR